MATATPVPRRSPRRSSSRPDLVLLDLYLPDQFGLDVLGELHAAGHDCDVMVITAAKEADAVAGRRAPGRRSTTSSSRSASRTSAGGSSGMPRGAALSRSSEVCDQEDIDRVLTSSSPSTGASALPRGLSPETAGLVEEILRKQAGNLSAAECADQVGISRVSARRYLEHFAAVGQAAVTSQVRKHRTAGTPLPLDGPFWILKCEAGRRTEFDLGKREAPGRGGCSWVRSNAVRCGSAPFRAPVAPNALPDHGPATGLMPPGCVGPSCTSFVRLRGRLLKPS